MYKSPLTKEQIIAVAAEVGVTESCFLRGGKSQLLANIINHLDNMRLFSVIIGTPESLKHAESDKALRDRFISRALVTDDESPPEKRT